MLRPDLGPDMGTIPEIRLPPSLVAREGFTGGGKRREQQGGSPLVKAEAAEEIAEAVRSPLRGATL